MLSVSLAVLGATLLLILFSPRRYEAELKLFLKRERVDAPVTSERGISGPRIEVSESEINSEIELFRDRDLLEKAVEACGLMPAGASGPEEGRKLLTEAARDLDRDLKIGPIRKTSLISVRYAARDRDQAARVVNTTADLYLEKHTAVHRNRDTSEFFNRQAAYYKRALATAQKNLSAFQERHEISLLDQQKQANLGRITALEASFQETESQIREAERRTDLLRQQREALPVTIQAQSRMARNEPLMEKLKSLLVDLENKRTELLTKYGPSYRLVREVEKQIRDTQATLEREQPATVVDQTDTVNPLRQSIEAELLHTETLTAGSWARRASLAKDLNYYRDRQQRLERITAEHNELQRLVKVTEDNYVLYQKKEEESRIADAMDRQKILNVSIVQRASPPALPMDRHRSLMLVLGLAVAAFAGIGLALAADYFDRPIGSVAELIAFTRLPVLATISKAGAACSCNISD